MKKKDVTLSDAEWRLMQALWRGGEMTIREIMDEVEEETGWSVHSVISFLKRMEGKGAVTIREGRPIHYAAALDHDEAVHQETREVLGRVYGGDRLLMIKCAVEAETLTEEEQEELIAMLRGGRK